MSLKFENVVLRLCDELNMYIYYYVEIFLACIIAFILCRAELGSDFMSVIVRGPRVIPWESSSDPCLGLFDKGQWDMGQKYSKNLLPKYSTEETGISSK